MYAEKLTNKKVIIYGDERYIRDFLYVFDKITVSYWVNDEKNVYFESPQKISFEDKNSCFVIICKYNETKAISYLKSLGYVRGVNYASATEFFGDLDFPIKDISIEKDVYVWGTGSQSHNFFHNFVDNNPDVSIIGCIDNDIEKKGKTFFRRPIYLPNEIIEKKDIFFIIAVNDYYSEIKEQLEDSGKTENIDFIHHSAINHEASRIMRETIYDVPTLDYICPKIFNTFSTKTEGNWFICSGMVPVLNKVTPMYYSTFSAAWHSNIMKIIRLSAINGTYSFCMNGFICKKMRESTNREFDINEVHHGDSAKERTAIVAKKNFIDKNTIFNRKNYDLKEKDFPDKMQCAWDSTCNLHCPSCRNKIYIAVGNEKEKLLNFTERIKNEVLINVNKINIAGHGEAFFSECYKNILFDSKLAKKVEHLEILSNGALFTPENFNKISDIWKKIDIFISMDGATKETAEKLRAGISFDMWLKNIKYLGEMRKKGKIRKLYFNYVVQKDNYKEMPQFAKFCLENNADAVRFARILSWSSSVDEISMFKKNGEMKPELAEVVKDPIFNRPEIYLFKIMEEW